MSRLLLVATLACLPVPGTTAAEPFALDLGPLGASQVVFSPDSKTIGVATFNELLVIDAATGSKRAATRQLDNVWALAFAPDSLRLACAVQSSDQKPVKLYDATSLKLEAEINTGTSVATAVAYSPDGATLAVGCDQQVLLVDAAALTILATLRGHTGTIGAIRGQA